MTGAGTDFVALPNNRHRSSLGVGDEGIKRQSTGPARIRIARDLAGLPEGKVDRSIAAKLSWIGNAVPEVFVQKGVV